MYVQYMTVQHNFEDSVAKSPWYTYCRAELQIPAAGGSVLVAGRSFPVEEGRLPTLKGGGVLIVEGVISVAARSCSLQSCSYK
jgi:hypothetical protein